MTLKQLGLCNVALISMCFLFVTAQTVLFHTQARRLAEICKTLTAEKMKGVHTLHRLSRSPGWESGLGRSHFDGIKGNGNQGCSENSLPLVNVFS